MKFQDSSFNGLKVTVGTKSVTHAPTHAPKAICPINFFKVGGIINLLVAEIFMFESVNGCTDGHRLDSYPISSPCEPSARVS